MSLSQQFIADSQQKAFEPEHRTIINNHIRQYDLGVREARSQFGNLKLARRRAAMLRHRVLESLEETLKDFEQHFTARGGKVLWAQDQEEARKAILHILENNYVKLVVKGKSSISHELALTEFLGKNGIDNVEANLGEFILQIAGDKPYHPVSSAMHLSAADIARLFHEKFGMPENATPEEITQFARTHLREKFLKAQAAITGANFLVSSSGSVGISDNEGSELLAGTLPPIHIVVAGIEQVIPTLKDLDLLWPLLSSHSTGHKMAAYNIMVNGPRQSREEDGPEQVFVVLVDNGRSRLLSAIPQRRALSCIRCGACMNACPVFKNVGGQAYKTILPGPIGAVIAPHLHDSLDEYKHLSFASSLCGRCTEACPVDIDLHLQLLQNRNLMVRKGLTTRGERLTMNAWSHLMRNRKWMDYPSARIKNLAFSTFFGKAWGPRRQMPHFAEKSFAELWREKNGSPE